MGIETPSENGNNKDLNSLLNQAKIDYIDDILAQGGDFLDIESEDFESDSFNDFSSYLNTNGANKYGILATELANYSPEQKKVIAEQLKQVMLKESIKNDKNKQTLENQFNKDYKINGGLKLKDNLKKLKISETQELIKSELKRKQFIKKNYKKEQYTEIENDEIIKDIEKLVQQPLTEDQQQAIYTLSESKNHLNSRETLDLLSAFNEEGKIKLLKYFNNPINLNLLLEYGIIDRVKAYGLLEQSIKKTYPNLKNKDIEKYLPSMEGDTGLLKEINISIDELESMGDKSLEKLVNNDNILVKIQDSLNENKEKDIKYEAEGDYLKLIENGEIELDKDGNIHGNYKELIKNQISKKTISEEIKNSIDKFEAGNYLNIKLNGEETFYYIEAVDLGKGIPGKRFKVKNLKSPFGNGLLKKEHVESELLSYEKLYDLFKASSNPKEGITESKIEFIDSKDFKQKEEKGEIELHDGLNNISSEKDLKNKLIENGNLDSSLENIPLSELCFLDDVHKEKGGDGMPFFRSFQAVGGDKLVFEGSNQEMDFSAFFAEIKKGGEGKYKFEKRISQISEIVEKPPLNDITYDEKGKRFILKKDKKEGDKAKTIDYFVTKSGKGAIHIDKVTENGIEYSIGEIDEKKSGEGKNKKIKKIFTGKNNYDGINQFLLNLKDDDGNIKYTPDTEGKAIEKKENNEELLNKNGGFFNKVMKNASITELLQGGKMVLDTIEQHLEHGNKLKAAKIAEKMGFVLPDTLKVKLKSKAEKETSELIKERVDMWKVMGSGQATKDIKDNILFNKHAEDHEVLAAMMYMAEKDGGLYAKALVGNQSSLDKGYSSYLWFRKLGGTRKMWEEEVKKIQNSDAKNSKSGRPDPSLVSEEKIVMSILAKRANDENDSSFPSKIYKDFWGALETGHEKRMEKGVNESASLHTAAEKVDYTIKYLAKGEGSRFMGAMEKTLGKDSDPYSMNVMPFVLGMSGASRHWHSMLAQKLHAMDATTAYPTLEMMKSEEGIDLYQNAIFEFLDKSGNTEAYNRLKKIKSMKLVDQINGKGDNLQKFFLDKNNRDLLLNFITLRDGFAATRKGDNPILGNFYDRITAKFSDREYSINEDSMKAGTYEKSALADANAKLDEIKVTQGGDFYSTIGKRTAEVYIKRLEEIKNLPSKDENPGIGIDEEERKRLWLHVFKPFHERSLEVLIGISKRSEDDLSAFYTTKLAKYFKKENLLLAIGEHSEKNMNKDSFYNLAYECHLDSSKYASEINLDGVGNTLKNTQDLINSTIDPSKIKGNKEE